MTSLGTFSRTASKIDRQENPNLFGWSDCPPGRFGGCKIALQARLHPRAPSPSLQPCVQRARRKGWVWGSSCAPSWELLLQALCRRRVCAHPLHSPESRPSVLSPALHRLTAGRLRPSASSEVSSSHPSHPSAPLPHPSSFILSPFFSNFVLLSLVFRSDLGEVIHV